MALLRKFQMIKDQGVEGHLVARVAEEELVVVACSSASRAHLAGDALPRLETIVVKVVKVFVVLSGPMC